MPAPHFKMHEKRKKQRKKNKLMDEQMVWQSDSSVDSDGEYVYAH